MYQPYPGKFYAHIMSLIKIPVVNISLKCSCTREKK